MDNLWSNSTPERWLIGIPVTSLDFFSVPEDVLSLYASELAGMQLVDFGRCRKGMVQHFGVIFNNFRKEN